MCERDTKEFANENRMIAEARLQHQGILQKLMQGPGDSEGAMRRAEEQFGLPYWSQHSLRYRRTATPKFIERVRQAYLALLEQSVRRDLKELEIERAKGTADAHTASLIAEAEALLSRIAEKKVSA